MNGESGVPHEFVGAENYRGSTASPLSFDVIVLQHVQAVLRSSLSDWSGGFFGQKPHVHSTGVSIIEVWVESSADVYTHGVLALYDILSGYLDEGVEVAYSSLQNDMKVLQVSYSDVVNAQGNIDKYRLMSYKYQRAHLHRRLFRALMLCLKKQDYLGKGASDEGLIE